MMIPFLYATSLFEPVDQQTNRHLGLAKYHFKKNFVSNMKEYPGGGSRPFITFHVNIFQTISPSRRTEKS